MFTDICHLYDIINNLIKVDKKLDRVGPIDNRPSPD